MRLYSKSESHVCLYNSTVTVIVVINYSELFSTLLIMVVDLLVH